VHQDVGVGVKRFSGLVGKTISIGRKSDSQKGQIDDALTGQTELHDFPFGELHLRRHVALFGGSRGYGSGRVIGGDGVAARSLAEIKTS
jgi:hypothetical protein